MNLFDKVYKQKVVHLVEPWIDVSDLNVVQMQGEECENVSQFQEFSTKVQQFVDVSFRFKQSLEFSVRQRTQDWHVDAKDRLKTGRPGLVFVYASHSPTVFKDCVVGAGLTVFSQDVLHKSSDVLECCSPRLFMRLIIPNL